MRALCICHTGVHLERHSEDGPGRLVVQHSEYYANGTGEVTTQERNRNLPLVLFTRVFLYQVQVPRYE